MASWFPFPDNAAAQSLALRSVSGVVITHEHQDHLDEYVLRQVPTSVPVFVPEFPSRRMAAAVRRAGHEPVIVRSGATFAVGDVEGCFFTEPSPMNHDAAVAFRNETTSVLNLNDARISPLQLREALAWLGDHVDVLLAQAVGASWYPACYDYPVDHKNRLSAVKRETKYNYVARAAGIIRPHVLAPIGGPPCFLDPDLQEHNLELRDWCALPTALTSLAGDVVGSVVDLLPGAVLVGSEVEFLESVSHRPALRDLPTYVDEYRGRRERPVQSSLSAMGSPSRDLDEPIRQYFDELVSLSSYFRGRVNCVLGLEITGARGGFWTVDFTSHAAPVRKGVSECNYLMTFEARWMEQLLTGTLVWEDLLLSNRVRLSRNPDKYNDHLLGLLKFADSEPLRAVEVFESRRRSDEWIRIGRSDGSVVDMQRSCPHAGNDLLEFGEVVGGETLTCLAHHYTFDLYTGSCQNADCVGLEVRPHA